MLSMHATRYIASTMLAIVMLAIIKQSPWVGSWCCELDTIKWGKKTRYRYWSNYTLLITKIPETYTQLSVSDAIVVTALFYDTSRGQLKCDGTRAETRFRLSAKRTSPFKSAGASVQSTTGNRGVRISGSNAGYTMFRGSVKGTGYPLHSPVSPSLPLPCVTVCRHISTGA